MRLQSKTIKKRYGRNKGKYSYTQYLMPFPAKGNEELKPFLKKDLKFKMNMKDDTLNVSLEKPNEVGEPDKDH